MLVITVSWWDFSTSGKHIELNIICVVFILHLIAVISHKRGRFDFRSTKTLVVKTEFCFSQGFSSILNFDLNIFLLIKIRKSCNQMWSNICNWKIFIYVVSCWILTVILLFLSQSNTGDCQISNSRATSIAVFFTPQQCREQFRKLFSRKFFGSSKKCLQKQKCSLSN